jgi:hypothetical protein
MAPDFYALATGGCDHEVLCSRTGRGDGQASSGSCFTKVDGS